MSETFTKCSCRACGGHIEFPSHAVGMSIPCPHCGTTTDLYAEPAIPPVRPISAPPSLTPPPPPIQATPPPPPTPAGPRLQIQGGSYAPAASVPASPRLQVASAPPPAPPTAVADYAEETEGSTAATFASRRPINWIGWSLATASIVLFLIGGMMYLSNVKKGKTTVPSLASLRKAASKPSAAKADEEDETEPNVSAATKSTKASARAKSPDDLKPGPIALQRAGGGSRVVYAVGTLRNDSDFQRFGVKVELELLDAAGKQILMNGRPAMATDYVQVIEPHKDWRFRALIVAPKTASVKIAKIKEEE